MAVNDPQVSQEVPSELSQNTDPLKSVEHPSDSPLGVYAPFPWSPEPFAKLSEKARHALMTLDDIATKTDVAARRFEVEQAWESLHFDRGYQHLLHDRRGGWVLPGNSTGYGAKDQQASHSVYDTNVYGPKGDIIVAALSREVPKVEFFPKNPDYQPDVIAAEESNKFQKIWAKNNNLHALLVDVARIFWNEDRCVLWTRYEINGQQYGFEEETEVPTVPEDMGQDLSPLPTGQEELDTILDSQQSPPEVNQEGLEDVVDVEGLMDTPPDQETNEIIADVAADKKPLGREVTSVFGKLSSKVPITASCQQEMHFVQLMLDVDVSIAKATFPWIASKIKPGTDANSESQLDRIARENTNQAILGAYVTGDSLARHCTIKYSWFRPSFFLDGSVNDEQRAELLEAFPNGCLLAKAGQEFAFARNESMDKHITIGHPIAGKGQNRRALGMALISVQKRINDWVDLLDDFFKRTVPKKWMNADAFDLQAIRNQPNTPGSIGPFLPQPGLTAADQYIMVEPTPQPQNSLADFIKWFITSLSEEISGALPSLFGAATNTDTVGGIEIQRDQALQRIGCPWNYIQDMFATAALQAVECAKECRDAKKNPIISELIPESGSRVQVNTTSLIEGNVLCYPEANPAFPESWAQREAKLMALVDGSSQNPELAKWMFSPQNLPALVDGIRMKEFKVPGADSVDKQKSEFELLLRSEPQDNPQLAQVQQAIQQGEQHAAMAPDDPQVQQAMQQLQQLVKTLPPQVSSIPVAQDESENHAIEADTCLWWMNSPEGQKFKFSIDPKQKAAFENVRLHWKEHNDMAKKIAAENAPAGKPPSESFSATIDKMPANVAIQMLGRMGIQATPEDFAQHNKELLQQKVAQKTMPEVLKTTA